MIIKLAERELRTRFGVFTEILFYDGQRESIALVMGDVSNADDVLCRIHSACIGGHVFNSVECDCSAEMAAAQQMIDGAGRGVIVYLDQEGKGNGHLALIESIKYKTEHGQSKAYEMAGYPADARDYRSAAKILSYLGIRSVAVLTVNPAKSAELTELGVIVSRAAPIVT